MAELEHVGVAVENVEATLRVLEDVLQVAPYKTESIEKDRIRTHFVRGGGAKLELLESLDPESPVARFIHKRGPGLHHLAFEVEDIDAAHRRLSSSGYKPLDEAPRDGADGKRIFFLHPKDTAGILVELCQTDRSILGAAETMGDVRIRSSVGGRGPLIDYFHGREPDPPPDILARALEQQFSFRSIEATEGVDAASLGKAAGNAAGIVASGDLVPSALRVAMDVRPAGLVLIHPPESMWPVELQSEVLIIGRDDAGLDAAVEARASIPGSALAIVPHDDPPMISRLIRRHFARLQGT